jgi:Hint domain
MTSEMCNSTLGMRRSRRNIMKMGAILAPVALGRIHSAVAAEPAICTKIHIPVVEGIIDALDPKCQCFLKGTRIRTADGERKIEDLAIGDLLPTVFGGLQPVQWIGRYPLRKSDPSKPWVEDALPVRIARSALNPDVPHTDLFVSAFHSLLIDGVLVPAEMLINGATITRYEAREYDQLEFFHIKLESHDVVYAEGVPAETLLKVEESAVNFTEYFRRYGAPTKEEALCAPFVHLGGGRVELMSRFRSALSPWIDLRDQADVVRDRLEEGGIVSWGSEPV